jgi:hypothetical protein
MRYHAVEASVLQGRAPSLPGLTYQETAVDIPILKYVDILIGLSLVMLLVSTIVLAITQVLLNSTFARARHLQRGLSRLVTSVDPTLMRDHAQYLSRLLVRHPLVGQRTVLSPLRRLAGYVRAQLSKLRKADAKPLPPLSPGSVVQREELAYLLIEFAAGEGPLLDGADGKKPPEAIVDAQQALARALSAGGVEDPAATLRAIRLKIVENERAEPDEPSTRWRTKAVVDCGASDFIAKLYASFDATMARVSDAFTAESSLWVSAVALLVALAFQLDSIELVRRLSLDSAYRATLVQAAERFDPKSTDPAVVSAQTQAQESLALLSSPPIDLLPSGVPRPDSPEWRNRLWAHLPGVLLSWVLLSLGAPFWFDALKNLLKLRSTLAKKEEADRDQRAAAQPPRQRATPVPSGPADRGEAGDLAASGAAG